MSWFVYSDQQKRRYRKGIWLRLRSLPEDLLAKIKSNMQDNETLAWVVVQELRPKNQVLLEVWCNQLAGMGHWPWKKTNERFTVFHLLVDEDPNWVCEGDLGRGFVK